MARSVRIEYPGAADLSEFLLTRAVMKRIVVEQPRFERGGVLLRALIERFERLAHG